MAGANLSEKAQERIEARKEAEAANPFNNGDRVVSATWAAGIAGIALGDYICVNFDEGEQRTVPWRSLKRGARTITPIAANDNEPPSFICPASWQGMPVPAREWWLENLVPMRQVTIVNGDGGVGKSLLALQLAASGALQCETLGMRPLTGRVMYVGAEDEAEEFHRRLVDIVSAHQRQLSDLDDFRLLPLADRDALLSIPERDGTMKPTPLWFGIARAARTFKPRLIVLDTAADLFGGDEIKRGQVRQFIGMLRKLAMELDCAVVLLAHPSVAGMQTGTGSSGSTAWNNSVRSRLYLTRPEGKDGDPDVRILKTMKANYGKTGTEIRLQWQDGAFILDDGKPSMAAGMVARRDDELFRDLLSAINRTGQRVAPTTGVNYAPSIMGMRPEAKGTSKKALEASMHRLLSEGIIKVVMYGPPSKRRQQLIVSAEDFGPDREAA